MSNNEGRWNAFDLYKGILIFMVVIGHIVPENINESIVRYMCYAYHMPLFIGISGFLTDINKWEQLSFISLLKKYWKRAIYPWLVTVTVWVFLDVVDLLMFNTATGKGAKRTALEAFQLILNRYTHPPYHLWYIPAWLGYILLSYILFRLIRNRSAYALIWSVFALIISILSYQDPWAGTSSAWDWIQRYLRPYNLIFFVAGILIRQFIIKYGAEKCRIPGKILSLCALLLLAKVVHLYFQPDVHIKWIVFYTSNLITLAALIYAGISTTWRETRILGFIGRNSLPFYLYHAFPLYLVGFFGRDLFGILQRQLLTIGDYRYYISVTLLTVVIFTLIYLGRNSALISKCLYGNTAESAKEAATD